MTGYQYMIRAIIAKYLAANPGTGEGVALGETQTTAYRGDRGKAAYDHSQGTHAPATAQKNSDITKEEIEAKLTGEVTSHSHAGGGLTQSQILTRML